MGGRAGRRGCRGLFFSSRRRHTRYWRDWSSDVCSSDLEIMSLILSSLSQGLLWSIMAIGVYLTFRILDIADLTAEGSYPLGAAICATRIVSGDRKSVV